MDFSGKDTVLGVVRREAADFFAIVDDPKNWKVQTRCITNFLDLMKKLIINSKM